MGEAFAGLLEGPYHVQPPDREWPGEGDGLQCGRGQMRLMRELLAPDAALDDVGGVGMCGEPEETVPKGLRDDGARAGVMATVAGMDVVELSLIHI